MKNNSFTTIRALCTILIGSLLIVCPENATTTLVVALGTLFLISGLVSILSYLKQHYDHLKLVEKMGDDAPKKSFMFNFFPVLGIGCFLFGIALTLVPNIFTGVLLYALGAFLIVGGTSQIYKFITLRKLYYIGVVPYIVSSLIIASGLLVVAFNLQGCYLDVAAFVFGASAIVYSITEIAYLVWFRNRHKKAAAMAGSADKQPS